MTGANFGPSSCGARAKVAFVDTHVVTAAVIKVRPGGCLCPAMTTVETQQMWARRARLILAGLSGEYAVRLRSVDERKIILKILSPSATSQPPRHHIYHRQRPHYSLSCNIILHEYIGLVLHRLSELSILRYIRYEKYERYSYYTSIYYILIHSMY